MKSQKTENLVVSLLTSPWTILVAIAVAVFIGLMFKDVASAMKPFGLMYLYMLQMTVIPIIVSAIVSSIAGLAKSSEIGKFLVRMLSIFVLMLVFASLMGTFAGIIGRPGKGLDETTRNTLGKIVETEQDKYAPDLEISLSAAPQKEERVTLVDFFVNMIPKNIFQSLSSGRALELIFFSIIFGIAVGVVREQKGEFLISIFDGMFKAFQRIISWLLILLPFGLIFLLADQIASTGVEILLAMMKFILVFFAAGLAVIVFDILVIWRRSHESFITVLKAILDPLVVALVTRSSFATLPAAIKSLVQKLGFYERSTNLFFSLGITLGRFGNIIYFALASMFVAQLYGVDLGIDRYAIIVIGSLFAGMATAGATGVSTLTLLSIVLGPLGLPLEAVLIIFIAIDTIADPLRTLLIVLTNMAANALIVPKVGAMNRRIMERELQRDERKDAFLERIKEKGEIVVAVSTREAPPYYYTGSDGDMRGLSIDVTKALADRLGVQWTPDTSAENDEDLIALVRDEKVDVALSPYSFDQIYENELCYSAPYITSHQALSINRDALAKVRTEEGKISVRNLTGDLGVVASSIHGRTAGRLFDRMRAVEFESLADALDAVLSGDIAVVFGNEVELKHALSRRPAGASSAVFLALKNREDSLRLAIAPQNRAFLEIFDTVIKEVRVTETVDQLVVKYSE